jgi:hypothetical protein
MQHWVGLKGRYLILPAHLIFAPLQLLIFHSSLLANIDLLGGSALCRPISVLFLPRSAHFALICPSDPQRRHTRTWQTQVSVCTVPSGQKQTRSQYQDTTGRLESNALHALSSTLSLLFYLEDGGSGFRLQRGLRYGDSGSYCMSKVQSSNARIISLVSHYVMGTHIQECFRSRVSCPFAYCGVKVWPHAFLSSALYWDRWSLHGLAALLPGKEPPLPTEPVWTFRREENLWPLPEIKLLFLTHPTPELFRLQN